MVFLKAFAALNALALSFCGLPLPVSAQIFPTSQYPPTNAMRQAEEALLHAAADSIFRKMTPDQRAAQLIMVASSTYEKIGTPYSTAKALVQSGVAGGVVFLKGPTSEFSKQTKELRTLTASQPVAPLFACDCEPTLFKMKWTDAEAVDKTNTLNTSEKVEAAVATINETMKATGVNLNFAPVADLGANKAVINARAFSNNPDSVALRAADFVRYTQAGNIGATIKHFPGHGNVTGDTHKQLVFINGALTELETFRKIIDASHPAAVMVGHIAVRNNPKYNTDGLPSSLSPVIITGLLREEMGYDGLITTDALNMQGAKQFPDADFKAIAAGVDIAVMPANPTALHARIVKELSGNTPLRQQLEKSVKRVIYYKLKYPAQP